MTFLTTFILIIMLYNQIWQNFKYLMTSSRRNTLKTHLRVSTFLGSAHFPLVPGLNYSKKSKLAYPQRLQETSHFLTLAAIKCVCSDGVILSRVLWSKSVPSVEIKPCCLFLNTRCFHCILNYSMDIIYWWRFFSWTNRILIL